MGSSCFWRFALRSLGAGLALAAIGLGGWWVGKGLARHQEASSLRAAGLKALQKYDFAGAHGFFQRALTLAGPSQDLHLLAAQAARRAGMIEEAELHLQFCEALPEPGSECAMQRKFLRAQQGDFKDFMDELAGLAKKRGSAAQVQAAEALALGFAHKHQYGPAQEWVEHLLEQDPDHVPALYLRGKSLLKLSDFEHALEDFAAILRKLPHFFQARVDLAETLGSLGRAREAVSQWEALRQEQPANPRVLLGLARCRIDLFELHKADELLQELLNGHPDYQPASLAAGQLALAQKQPDRAAKLLARAVELKAHDLAAHHFLILALEAQGKKQAAAAWRLKMEAVETRKAVPPRWLEALDPQAEAPDVLWKVGTAFLENGDEENGMAVLFSLLHISPRHADAHRLLAEHFDKTGQPNRAAWHRSRLNSP